MNDRSDANCVGEANLRFARALVGELHLAGVAAAFVCPGSRSTPLALAIAEREGLRHSVHVDERSAAFQALGFAKASGRPVVLLCTSGTAGANFLPAVAEADRSRVPLVILTADRPPELRAWGAAQTMEQRTLYAGFTRWSEEAPCPSERSVASGYACALGRRAVLEATGPAPGPVHLNLPFREPLLPASIEGAVQGADVTRPRPLALQGGEYPLADLDGLAKELRGIERGVLVFGPDSWDPTLGDAVHALATALDWPVLADPASGLRAGRAARRHHHSRCGPAVARCHSRDGSRAATHRSLWRSADERRDQRLDGAPRHGRRVAGRSRQWISRPAASCDSGAPGEFAPVLPATFAAGSSVCRARRANGVPGGSRPTASPGQVPLRPAMRSSDS